MYKLQRVHRLTIRPDKKRERRESMERKDYRTSEALPSVRTTWLDFSHTGSELALDQKWEQTALIKVANRCILRAIHDGRHN